MGRGAVKNAIPVKLPHDGPIFLNLQCNCYESNKAGAFSQENETCTSHSCPVTAVFSMRQACQFIQKSKERNDSDLASNPNLLSPSMPQQKLIRTLLHAVTISEQLKALQVFKSTLLSNRKQRKKQQQELSEKLPNNDSPQPRNAILFSEYASLYRVLFEWLCSSQTSTVHPLRRAIQSNLDTLHEEILEIEEVQGLVTSEASTRTSNADIFDSNHDRRVDFRRSIVCSIMEDVLQTIAESIMGKSAILPWKDPLLSLQEALSYQPAAQHILLSPSSQNQHKRNLKDNECQNCIWGIALRGLQSKTAHLHEFFVKNSGDKDSLEENGEAGMNKKEIGDKIPHSELETRAAEVIDGNVIWNSERVKYTEYAVRVAWLIKNLLQHPQDCPLSTEAEEGINSLAGYQNKIGEQMAPVICQLQDFLWFILSNNKTIPLTSDGLSTVVIAYGRTIFYGYALQVIPQTCRYISLLEHTVHMVQDSLPALQQAMVFQGLAASCPDAVLLCRPSSQLQAKLAAPESVVLSPLETLMQKLRNHAFAAGAEVRLAAVKGIRSLVSRCTNILEQKRHYEEQLQPEGDSAALCFGKDVREMMQHVAEQVLQIVLQSWENPTTSNKRLGSAVASLFESLVSFVQELNTDKKTERNAIFQGLVQMLLKQPVNCKGRYLALEELLPLTGASCLLGENNGLVSDLISGISDAGHNTRVIADLWVKLLQQYLQECLRRADWQLNSSAAPSRLNRSQRRKMVRLQQQQRKGEQSGKADNHQCSGDNGNSDNPEKEVKPTNASLREPFQPEPSIPVSELQHILPNEWLAAWVPSLAQALLLTREWNRCKQIAAFCLPRIFTVCRGIGLASTGPSSAQDIIAQAFMSLLQQVDQIAAAKQRHVLTKEALEDRQLWVTFEVTRLTSAAGLLTETLLSSQQLKHNVTTALPVNKLRLALVHSSENIRVSAFQAMETVVATYQSDNVCAVQPLALEIELWKFSLPYAMKSDGKDYISILLQCLLMFVDRLSRTEAQLRREKDKSRNVNPLPRLFSFIVEFCLGDLVLKKGAYTGTVYAKETFSLGLLDCIIALLSISLDNEKINCKFVFKNSSVFRRHRDSAEISTMLKIRKEMLGREVFATAFSLMHSIWDSTRSHAFKILLNLAILSQDQTSGGLECIIPEYGADYAINKMELRATFLASSPRQREADTGARMMAFVYFATVGIEKRLNLLWRFVDILEQRITLMTGKLAVILSDNMDYYNAVGEDGELPLAHGIIQCLRLIVEHHKHVPPGASSSKTNGKIFCDNTILERMAQLFCRAIQVSLALIADVRQGEFLDGSDEDLVSSFGEMSVANESRTNKVNPGTIGANGIFSTVNRAMSTHEQARRMASQRLVVGSWLLTRETCGALATIIEAPGFSPEVSLVEEAGMLLISTLTSLKHTGAAYAAHNAIQKITTFCFSGKDSFILDQLPEKWLTRLLSEISETERVRDSTLRRSTGFCLGFLSIMRSEVKMRSVSPRPLCRQIMMSILRLSLPLEKDIRAFLEMISLNNIAGNSGGKNHSIFSFLTNENNGAASFVRNKGSHQVKTRVHALNSLRMIILDAPLSHEVYPIVGDAIISAIIGYTDDDWAIRNSSTMVFSAAMLRAIDSDKNASNADTTSSNAVPISELFRSFPFIPNFLLSAMKWSMESERSSSFTPVMPILLLLSRVQPVRSGQNDISQAEPFIAVLLQCLDHEHQSVRKVAARALANLSSGQTQSPTYFFTIIQACRVSLSSTMVKTFPTNRKQNNWNLLHGSLLAIKELTLTSSDAKFAIRELVLTLDLTGNMMGGGQPVVPPPCIKVLVEILSFLSEDAECNEAAINLCRQVIGWLDEQGIDSLDAIAIGASELGTTVGLTFCKSILTRIWANSITPADNIHSYMNDLARVFNSENIDVRVSAVKTFKKSVYSGLDEVLDRFVATGYDGFTKLVDLLTDLLSKSLERELCRGMDTKHVLGSDPPTLRRMSRCLLECMVARERMGGIKRQRDLYGQTSKLALAILYRENAFQDGVATGMMTPLIGNALELLSFNFAVEGSRDLLKENEFVGLLSKFTDPALSWRLRYSAVSALRTSKILCRHPKSLEEESVRFGLTLSALKLLQDEDPDVRRAASRELSSLCEILLSNASPEYVLIEAHKNVLESFDSDKIIGRFMCDGLNSSFGLEDKVLNILEELNLSKLAKSPSDLLNVGTKRKIFEDEEPNSYLEISLTSQLSVVAMLRCTHESLSARNHDTVSKLLERCGSILSLMKQENDEAFSNKATAELDICHELTRHSAFFQALHNLLLFSGCSIYLGGRDSFGVQLLAKHFVSNTTVAIHPYILEVLETISKAQKASDQTFEQLIHCCFLVPSDYL